MATFEIEPSGQAIPPSGGDTLFANQHAALEAMAPDFRARVEGLVVVHSARGAYAPDGSYGLGDQRSDRSMAIRPSAEALATQTHPLVRSHPETGRLGLFSCHGYLIAIEGMGQGQGRELLAELLHWQGWEEFQYRHRWEADMLVMWDNRSVLHRAGRRVRRFWPGPALHHHRSLRFVELAPPPERRCGGRQQPARR